MLVGDFFGQKADLLLAICRTFIAKLTRMRTQPITQLTLGFGKVCRDDLIGDSQSRQRGPSTLLGYFTCSSDLSGEEGTGVGMKRSVGHIS
jgi:hypothetical protein